MARPVQQQPQPEGATTPEQALVTPAVRPEVLLALQHQQSTQAINNECAQIRQEIGSLSAQIAAMKSDLMAAATGISGIQRTHHIGIGVAIAISVLIGAIWYFVGSKFSTLLLMADERQVSDMHKADAIERKRVENQASNSN